jgi:hypothetical protein
MAACPDCDAASVNYDFTGTGDCKYCHGTGEGGFLAQVVASLANAVVEPCPMRDGTGQCQTCGGTGEVDDNEDDK